MQTRLSLSALGCAAIELTSAIEHGHLNEITFDDIYRQIENGRLVPFLEDRLGDDIDLSLISPDQEQGQYLIAVLNEVAGGLHGRERKKLGVESCGLCLLLAFCIEAMQQCYWDTTKVR